MNLSILQTSVPIIFLSGLKYGGFTMSFCKSVVTNALQRVFYQGYWALIPSLASWLQISSAVTTNRLSKCAKARITVRVLKMRISLRDGRKNVSLNLILPKVHSICSLLWEKPETSSLSPLVVIQILRFRNASNFKKPKKFGNRQKPSSFAPEFHRCGVFLT